MIKCDFNNNLDNVKRLPIGSFYMEGEQLEGSMLVDDKKNIIDSYWELPDKIFAFKTCSININNLVILGREGFTDEEMSYIVNIIKNNKKFIIEIAEKGIAYANF